MGAITLVTGGARSGKSHYAVAAASVWGPDVAFVATYRSHDDDAEMSERVRRHRAARPPWRTLEAPKDIAGALRALDPAAGGVLIDCLTLWISDRLNRTDDALIAEWERQLAGLAALACPIVIVTNEVGSGLVPFDPVERRFRDLAGTLAQRTASRAAAVWLLAAGCPLRLK
jgi:adenosylcobinamide kinase/adenosylcobinamide-phosphate guanylyltransferase